MPNNNRRTIFSEHGGNLFYSQEKKKAKLKVSGDINSGNFVRGGVRKYNLFAPLIKWESIENSLKIPVLFNQKSQLLWNSNKNLNLDSIKWPNNSGHT